MRQELVDRLIAHQVDLTRYSNGVAARIRALLDRVDPDLFAQLQAALERLGPDRFTTQRLDRLLAEIRTINGRAYEAVTDALVEELRGLTEAELVFQVGITRMQAGASVQLASVTAETLYGAAMARPFQGRLLREWAESIGEQRMVRIRDAVRMGYVEGQTIGQIVQRIRGTRARGYSDGIIEIDRRHAEAVARTAISHVAGFVRDRWHEENDDIIEAVMWLSTLDGRTSNACKLRDQKRYTAADHKPIGHRIPWLSGPGRLHWNCRSSSIGLLRGQELLYGERAARSADTGRGKPVEANTTYGDWLRRQSAAAQDDILGPTRGALFRAGGLKIEDFANERGRWLTLEELRRRDAAAFERAGV
jgi:hypothetical protein